MVEIVLPEVMDLVEFYDLVPAKDSPFNTNFVEIPLGSVAVSTKKDEYSYDYPNREISRFLDKFKTENVSWQGNIDSVTGVITYHDLINKNIATGSRHMKSSRAFQHFGKEILRSIKYIKTPVLFIDGRYFKLSEISPTW